eukprot:TRINITY_DN12751_c0_g1_i1.p1 TRINITY_DN12751_c0_g1~~TRINITY_DN12751_c0_g1_i1.p1  ORF type:complete len:656 (+),score=117.73 TRINITY_DN12751_c0_g1_i1:54-2021(+)
MQRCVWGLALIYAVAAQTCANDPSAASWVQLLEWGAVGLDSRWVLAPGGESVTQMMASPKPGFFVSDADYTEDYVMTGRVRVADNGEADFIGVSVGHRGPVPGGSERDYNTMLFSWGGAWEVFMAHNEEAALSRISGTFNTLDDATVRDPINGRYACLYSRYRHTEADGTPLAEGSTSDGPARAEARVDEHCYAVKNTADGVGWTAGADHSVTVLYTSDVLKVRIDGTIKVELTKAQLELSCDTLKQDHSLDSASVASCKQWNTGRFGLYTFVQGGVAFSAFQKFEVPPDTKPAAHADFYEASRDAGDQTALQALSVPVGAGILGNDFTDKLGALTVSVNGAPVDNAPATVATAQGGVAVVEASGAFQYTPPAGARAGAFVDTFAYSVLDQFNQPSDPATVHIAYPIPSPGDFTISWAPATDGAASFWQGAAPGDHIGELTAADGCGAVRRWRFSAGNGGGRFGLAIGPAGAFVTVKTPALLAPKDTAQVWSLQIVAEDVGGKSATKTVNIVVGPLSVACPSGCPEHAACSAATTACVCDVGYGPPGACDKLCPNGGDCSATEPEHKVQHETWPPDLSVGVDAVPGKGCVVGEVYGECLGWAFVVIPVLLVIAMATTMYTKRKKARAWAIGSKRQQSFMKGCEIDKNLLEGVAEA